MIIPPQHNVPNLNLNVNMNRKNSNQLERSKNSLQEKDVMGETTRSIEFQSVKKDTHKNTPYNYNKTGSTVISILEDTNNISFMNMKKNL